MIKTKLNTKSETSIKNSGGNFMLKKEFTYELAVSYAREDQAIVDKYAEDFKRVFENVFFQDREKPGDLDSNDFNNRLRKIFGNDSRVVVVFYSEDYIKKEKVFTKTELEAIIERSETQRDDFLWFIINLDDAVIDPRIGKKFYHNYTENERSDKNYNQIITVIKQKIMEHNMKSQYFDDNQMIDLKVQTRFNPAHQLEWESRYNWCFLEYGFALSEIKTIKEWMNPIRIGLFRDFNYLKSLESFRCDKINLVLNCHLSVAYALGHLYGDIFKGRASNNILLRGLVNSTDFDFSKVLFNEAVNSTTGLEIMTSEKDYQAEDIVVIINICKGNRSIKETVEEQLKSEFKISYKKVIEFNYFEEIVDPQVLVHFAKLITDKIQKEIKCQSKGTLHIFARTLTPLMFLLGGTFNGVGSVQLYEHDFDRGNNAYMPSFKTVDLIKVSK